MPFRARLPDETDQQYSYRRTVQLIRESYLEPTEIRNESGDLVAELEPGEGIAQYTFDTFIEAFATFNGLVENPSNL